MKTKAIVTILTGIGIAVLGHCRIKCTTDHITVNKINTQKVDFHVTHNNCQVTWCIVQRLWRHHCVNRASEMRTRCMKVVFFIIIQSASYRMRNIVINELCWWNIYAHLHSISLVHIDVPSYFNAVNTMAADDTVCFRSYDFDLVFMVSSTLAR